MAPTSLVVSGLLLLTLLPSLVPAQTVTRKEKYLIVTNYYNVYVLNMRGEVQHEFNQTYSEGVDFDPTTARIFWTNYNQSTIETAFLNGSQRTVLRQLQQGTRPFGLAVDHILQLVFYSDYDSHSIGVMDTDGGSHRTVRDQGLRWPHALAVDVIHEVLYYTEQSLAGKIGRMDYNGSGHEVLINSSLLTPYGLALDVRGGRMYWTNWNGGTIESAWLDGTDRTLVLRNLSGPKKLAFFAGVLYFSCDFCNFSSIDSVTVNGTDRQILTTNRSGTIWDIAVYSESQAITPEEKLAALSESLPDGPIKVLALGLGIGLGLFALLSLICLILFLRQRGASSRRASPPQAKEMTPMEGVRAGDPSPAAAIVAMETAGSPTQQSQEATENDYEKINDYDPLDGASRVGVTERQYESVNAASKSDGDRTSYLEPVALPLLRSASAETPRTSRRQGVKPSPPNTPCPLSNPYENIPA